MKNVMYAAIAFAAISIGVTAIGIGKQAAAWGKSDFVRMCIVSGSHNHAGERKKPRRDGWIYCSAPK